MAHAAYLLLCVKLRANLLVVESPINSFHRAFHVTLVLLEWVCTEQPQSIGEVCSADGWKVCSIVDRRAEYEAISAGR